MIYLGMSLVASKKQFYQQNNRSKIRLDVTGLTITRVVSRNKKGVVIAVKIHKNVAQSVVLDDDHCF